jgi:branched-chain amino acid aminotransferase
MVERPLTVRELLTAHREGRLLEVFGSGTACVVQPVDCIVTADGSQLHLPANGSTKAAENSGTGGAGVDGIAGTVKQQLLDIQYGKVPHPWSVPYE